MKDHFSGLGIGLDHTLPKVIAHAARQWCDKPFCVDEDLRVTSYAEFARRVAGLGADLLDLGVVAGDRVAILAPNSTAWIVAASAIECIGAILVPINTRFKGPEVRFALEHARVAALFTVGHFLGTDYPAMVIAAAGGVGKGGKPAAALPHLRALIRLDDPDFAPDTPDPAKQLRYEAAAARVTPHTTADLMFTSGTTGRPKGALHSHGQALWIAGLWNEANDLSADDRMAVVNPFFHSFGYRSGWVSALTGGMTVWPLAMFDAGALLALIERERITQLSGAPTVFFSLMQHPDFGKRDIASLRSGHTGGAKTPPDIIRAGTEKFGFDILLTSYGQTESTALIAINRPGDPLEAIVNTVGRPIPHTAVRIVGADGCDLPPGGQGELLVRGPHVMQGYFEDPDQTAAAIRDGWLHTGDVASIDTDGRLQILDRIKDVVIVGGFNAYPAEIEIMLSQHPDIAEVAIIGVPDERLGEVTAACIVPQPAATLSLPTLAEWCRERMANYKVPRHLLLMDDFPRTPLGKIRKFELRDQALARLAGVPATSILR